MQLQFLNMRMSRIDVNDKTWLAFRSMCLEQGIETRHHLGQLVIEAVRIHDQAKPRPARTLAARVKERAERSSGN